MQAAGCRRARCGRGGNSEDRSWRWRWRVSSPRDVQALEEAGHVEVRRLELQAAHAHHRFVLHRFAPRAAQHRHSRIAHVHSVTTTSSFSTYITISSCAPYCMCRTVGAYVLECDHLEEGGTVKYTCKSLVILIRILGATLTLLSATLERRSARAFGDVSALPNGLFLVGSWVQRTWHLW